MASKKPTQTLKISIICLVAFAIGYYALNHISNRERPPLGNTTYIIGGCAAMAISALVLVITLKRQFFPKKKKKKVKRIFLDENMKTKSRMVE